MRIELRSRCPLPLRWVYKPPNSTTEGGEYVLCHGSCTLGWIFMDATVSGASVFAEVREAATRHIWRESASCSFDTVDAAKLWLLTAVRRMLCTDAMSVRWAQRESQNHLLAMPSQYREVATW